MAETKKSSRRAIVDLEPDLYDALRLKAPSTNRSLSEIVNAAVRQSLGKDADDLAVFDERAHEPTLAFADVLKNSKQESSSNLRRPE